MQLVARAARAVWWLGVPVLILGWFLLAGPASFYRPDALYTLANAWGTHSPVAAELLAEYPFWLAAMLLVIAVSVARLRRGVAGLRVETLLLPALIAGLEACVRLYWFLSCRGLGSQPTRAQLHGEVHVAATASLIAMAAPLLLLALTRRDGRRLALSALVAIMSVELIWAFFDVLLGP